MRKFRTLKFLVAIFFLLAICQQAYSEISKNELTEKSRSKYTNPQERDPFALPLALKKKLRSFGSAKGMWPELKLYGILLGEGDLEPKALINNDVVSVGGNIGPAKVVEIRKDSVKLELDGEFRIITIDK